MCFQLLNIVAHVLSVGPKSNNRTEMWFNREHRKTPAQEARSHSHPALSGTVKSALSSICLLTEIHNHYTKNHCISINMPLYVILLHKIFNMRIYVPKALQYQLQVAKLIMTARKINSARYVKTSMMAASNEDASVNLLIQVW